MKTLYIWLSSILLLLGCILIVPHGDFREVGAVPRFWLGIGVISLGFLLSWGLSVYTRYPAEVGNRKLGISQQAKRINNRINNNSIKTRLWQGVYKGFTKSLSIKYFRKLKTQHSGLNFWSTTILSRLLLLPMYPGDDVWRYLWEGYIQTLGFSPYHLPPNATELIPYHTEWWSLINHPTVSAIYPPVAQLGFRLLALIDLKVWLFKIAFILADLLICWLLSRRFGYQQAIFYAWNPLIIYSFAGGAHYDSWFILPLVAAWLVFDQKTESLRQTKITEIEETLDSGTVAEYSSFTNSLMSSSEHSLTWWHWIASALLVGISMAVKWMSLPILGFLTWQAFRKVGVKLAIVVLLCGFLPFGITALQFCSSGECPLIPTGSVFVSHGRSAELIPYIVSEYWEPSRWVNWIYAFPLGLTVSWLILRSRNFQQFTEWYFFSLLILSPIIHAWYFTWIIPFAVPSRNLGVRLVSISTFVYFVLQHRMALGNYSWYLTPQERWWLWLPFILGWLWTHYRNPNVVLNQNSD
ncbi:MULTISPECIES: glycosyl transferase family 2 [unclassified Moorena]|uniref:glycosyl transferase family 2 n=1 Tax=unclassified Moorena TaxID=2683338 RepID=UPI0025D6304C|nr:MULTISPECIES: glycosyl transferase family 2 [unclassified Moorena]